MNVNEKWLETFFDEISPELFYREIFPEGELDVAGSFTKGKYTGIMISVSADEQKEDGTPRVKRQSITDDLAAITEAIQSNDFCLCSPISYAGRKRTVENARMLYALAVDVDKLKAIDGRASGLDNLWNGHIQRANRVPEPSFIVSSGTGIHLYYVLDKPIPLFPEVARELQVYKHELTRLIWHDTVVDIKTAYEIQQEGIYQGFRMPGTITKNGGRARAFLTGERVSVAYLNQFVEEKHAIKHYTYTERQGLSLAEAAEKYPEWYQRRIIDKEPRGSWHINRALYDWWKRQIYSGAAVGHRYYCMMMLAIYAKKCGMMDTWKNPNPVSYEELERDCWELMKYFETLTNDSSNHFTRGDVLDALEAYQTRWITYPRRAIEFKSGIIIPPGKRNGRTQEVHLRRARAVQDIDYPDGEWRGNPSQAETVARWQREHPGGRKCDCIRDTGLSKPTVYKHWKRTAPE